MAIGATFEKIPMPTIGRQSLRGIEKLGAVVVKRTYPQWAPDESRPDSGTN